MINWLINILRKKDSRKIPLIHVHTFKTGEKLYTYSQENYGAIASRYYKAVNIALNYITMYNADIEPTIVNDDITGIVDITELTTETPINIQNIFKLSVI